MTLDFADWASTFASLRQQARTRVPKGDVEDVVAETMLGLCEHQANARTLRSWWGLADAMLRTNICRRMRRRSHETLIPPRAMEEMPQPSRMEGPPQQPANLAGLGAVQRAVVERVVAGESVAAIASALGRPPKAIHRVVNLLARKLSRQNLGPV